MICKRKRILGVIGTLLTMVAPIALAALSFLNEKDLDLFQNASLFTFVILAVFVFIACLKYLKNPVVDGKIEYRKGTLLLYILLDVVSAAFAFLEFKTDVEEDAIVAGLPLFGLIGIGVCVLAIAFIVISFCQNTRKYKVKEVVVKPEKQRLEIDTMYSVEKVKRMNQLKALNAIDDKEYADSIAKFSRGA